LKIRIGDELTETVRGLPQGLILSPDLYNIAS